VIYKGLKIGVLAFHGDFAEHLLILKNLDVTARMVKTSEDLSGVHGLIIPGGESTVMSKFLFDLTDTGRMIQKRVKEGTLSVYGTCAGAILLARLITGKNAPKTLGLMDIAIERNAYGSQAQSFESSLKVQGLRHPLHASFIRAPVITKVGKGVEVLAEYKGSPVLVRQSNLLAGTFHPEMRSETAIHELFLKF
jgi:5'-phosphate synthase pdxT subunit